MDGLGSRPDRSGDAVTGTEFEQGIGMGASMRGNRSHVRLENASRVTRFDHFPVAEHADSAPHFVRYGSLCKRNLCDDLAPPWNMS